MRPLGLVGKTLPLLFAASSAAAASSQDGTERICGNERLGTDEDTFTYFPNGWNVQSRKDGFVCLEVDTSIPAFTATWDFEKNIKDVRAFPYVRISDEKLPMRVGDIGSIQLSADWMYVRGDPGQIIQDFSQATWQENNADMQGNTVQANAAWDFFLDDDRNKTTYPQVAAIECMVWLGWVGDPWWHGRAEHAVLTNLTIGTVEFELYYGQNSEGTHVFSAISRNGTVLSLSADFSPLFNYILKEAGDHPLVSDKLPENPYLGIVEFGSEAWVSNSTVTFTAANFGMTLNQTVEAPDDAKNSTEPHDGSDGSGKGGGSNSTTPNSGNNSAQNNNNNSDDNKDDNDGEEDVGAVVRYDSVLTYAFALSVAVSVFLLQA